MYTKPYKDTPPAPPRGYAGTMYPHRESSPPRHIEVKPEPVRKPPDECRPEPETSPTLPCGKPGCECAPTDCTAAKCEAAKCDKPSGFLSGINLNAEDLLLIGLLLLLIANDADNDVIMMVAILLAVGFL